MTTIHTALSIKRVYAKPAVSDGFRVLVDRLWPRGLAKADAHIDLWIRAVAPSDALRQWFGHTPEKWLEFLRLYAAELDGNAQATAELLQALAAHRHATLLYAAKDVEHNNARALLDYLQAR